MRVEAGLRMLDNQDPSPVCVAHPDTGELVLVTREEILEHAEADGRVLEAAQQYQERQLRWHGRLIRALRPYGDRGTSIGDAVERAALELGIERDGRSFEEFAGLVVAAAEAQDGWRRGERSVGRRRHDRGRGPGLIQVHVDRHSSLSPELEFHAG